MAAVILPTSPPVRYQCQRCGNCCRWPGFVRLTDADIAALARHLGLSERAFIDQHTRLRPARDGLALLDKPNGECAFLDGRNRCAVQDAKPSQCRGFPNAWNFPGWREVCEATETDDAFRAGRKPGDARAGHTRSADGSEPASGGPGRRS